MTAAFTVILPHLRNSGNNAAFQITQSCLMANTVNEFALLIDTGTGESLYAIVNRMIAAAYTDIVVYWSSDMFPAVGWDIPMLELWTPETLVTNVLVEPGAIGVHSQNLHKDFGRRPDTFRRAEFEAWAANDAPMLDGPGWFAPYAISRSAFLAHGGLDDSGLLADAHGFTGADEAFFERWKASGNHIIRARSYAYHIQRWSQLDEQTHEKRNIQS